MHSTYTQFVGWDPLFVYTMSAAYFTLYAHAAMISNGTVIGANTP